MLRPIARSITNQATRTFTTSSRINMPTHRLNHTMFRIKDPKISLPFYTDVIGMKLLAEHPGGDFTNYFLAFPEDGVDYDSMSKDELSASKFKREGHNWGTEKDDKFEGYKSGNEAEHKGFGHIAIVTEVPLEKECKRLQDAGVKFKKLPHEGKMKHIAFALDPDNYWIEIISSDIKL